MTEGVREPQPGHAGMDILYSTWPPAGTASCSRTAPRRSDVGLVDAPTSHLKQADWTIGADGVWPCLLVLTQAVASRFEPLKKWAGLGASKDGAPAGQNATRRGGCGW